MRRAVQLVTILLAGVALGVSAVLVGQSDAPSAARAPAVSVSIDDLLSAKSGGMYDNPSAAAGATASWYRIGIVQRSSVNPASVRIVFDPGVLSTPSQPSATAVPSTEPSATVPSPTLTSTPSAPPTKKPTSTKTATPTDDDMPTEEVTIDPITDEPDPTICYVRTGQKVTYPLRSNHASTSPKLSDVGGGLTLTALGFYVIEDSTNEWVKTTYKGVTGWVWVDEDFYVGWDDTEIACITHPNTEYEDNPPPTPAPTQIGPTLTPLPPITGDCTIYNFAAFEKNVRAIYSSTSAIVFTIPPGGTAKVNNLYTKSTSEKWAAVVYKNPLTGQSFGGWAAVTLNGTKIYELQGDCSQIPDGPLAMGGPFTQGILIGPHFSWPTQFDYGALAPLISTAKCLPLTENICRSLKAINPNILIIWRDYRIENPTDQELRTDHLGYAARVFALVQPGYDYVEVMNELGFASDQYQHLSGFLIDVAGYFGARGVCILAPAFGPGWPDLITRRWNSVVEYLKWANRNPCGVWKDGTPKYHGLSWHASAYYPGNVPQWPWVNDPNVAGNAIIGNAQMNADLGFGIDDFLGPKMVTELGATDIYGGYNESRPSCEQNRLMIQRTKQVYSQNSAIFDGAVWWNFGSPGNWIDETRCLPGMFQ